MWRRSQQILEQGYTGVANRARERRRLYPLTCHHPLITGHQWWNPPITSQSMPSERCNLTQRAVISAIRQPAIPGDVENANFRKCLDACNCNSVSAEPSESASPKSSILEEVSKLVSSEPISLVFCLTWTFSSSLSPSFRALCLRSLIFASLIKTHLQSRHMRFKICKRIFLIVKSNAFLIVRCVSRSRHPCFKPNSETLQNMQGSVLKFWIWYLEKCLHFVDFGKRFKMRLPVPIRFRYRREMNSNPAKEKPKSTIQIYGCTIPPTNWVFCSLTSRLGSLRHVCGLAIDRRVRAFRRVRCGLDSIEQGSGSIWPALTFHSAYIQLISELAFEVWFGRCTQVLRKVE